MRIIVFAYDFPHVKTNVGINNLISNEIRPDVVISQPFKKLNLPQNKIQFKKQVLRTPLKTQVKLSEINAGISYLLDNPSITGEVLTLDSGQSLGWAHSKSKVFQTD